ncbi:hypothetical protein HK102_002778, partial [Quaeritorhiza haematococci]
MQILHHHEAVCLDLQSSEIWDEFSCNRKSDATGNGTNNQDQSSSSSSHSASHGLGSLSTTDFLTVLSQLILVGTVGFIAFAAIFPEKIADAVSEYKVRLTDRRHDNMLKHLASKKAHVAGKRAVSTNNASESTEAATPHGADDTAPCFQSLADDMKDILLKPPVLRYGIVVGAPGSGKSQLVRRVVDEGAEHVGLLSMGLVSSVKSLVDGLAEEVGYDFDDWTERMVNSYFFSGNAPSSGNKDSLDNLAFLLDEIEEACWKLKYSPPTSACKASHDQQQKQQQRQRPVLVFDDLDVLDMDEGGDPNIRKAVRMLFNAASKWAKEDTCQVVFTISERTYEKTLGKLLHREVLDNAKIYKVGHLSKQEAETFLRTRLRSTTYTEQDLTHVVRSVGTRIADLLRVTEEANKTHKPLPQVVSSILSDTADQVILRTLGDCSKIAKKVDQIEDLMSFLDDRAAVSVKKDDSKMKGVGEILKGMEAWDATRRSGITNMVEKLVGEDILDSRG